MDVMKVEKGLDETICGHSSSSSFKSPAPYACCPQPRPVAGLLLPLLGSPKGPAGVQDREIHETAVDVC